MRKLGARQNFKRYRRLLAHETDVRRWEILQGLLVDEENFWAGLAGDGGSLDLAEKPGLL